MNEPVHVLLCYDGSAGALQAIETAGRLFAGPRATILYAWHTAGEAAERWGPVALAGNASAQLEQDRAHARRLADDGAAAARESGLDATGTTAHGFAPAWATILRVADELDVDLIVLGSRGLTGFKSLLLGGVSHAVVQQATRPTLVIPSGDVVAMRARDEAAFEIELDPAP